MDHRARLLLDITNAVTSDQTLEFTLFQTKTAEATRIYEAVTSVVTHRQELADTLSDSKTYTKSEVLDIVDKQLDQTFKALNITQHYYQLVNN